MISSTFCAAPWTVHCINANGTASVCCVNNSVLASSTQHRAMLRDAAVQQMKKDMLQGRKANGCDKCYDNEQSGVFSLRQLYNEVTADTLDINKLTDNTYENRTWYDLSLGNKCNQKCRICGPYNSTAWYKDANSLSDITWAHVNWQPMDDAYVDGKNAIPDILESMQQSANPFRIELKGGEPLYMESSRELISSMIKLGLHLRTEELRIITNGTQHDDALLEMLRQFPSIDMGLSIDATGKLHEYTRGTNISWDQCRRSWSKIVNLPNIKRLRICNTIYAYNVFDLANLREWAYREFGNLKLMSDALLHTPRYLSIKILPIALRLDAANRLPTADEMISVISQEPTEIEVVDNLQNLRRQFKIFTARMDKLRNENLLELVPELASLMD